MRTLLDVPYTGHLGVFLSKPDKPGLSAETEAKPVETPGKTTKTLTEEERVKKINLVTTDL